jgi:DNA-binding IscR family transcriptional regulator
MVFQICSVVGNVVRRRRAEGAFDASARRGGALLTVPAESIRLLDVYEAVEDTELFSLHRTPPCETCPVGGNILGALQPALARAREAFEAELARVTIADVAADVTLLGQFSVPYDWNW